MHSPYVENTVLSHHACLLRKCATIQLARSLDNPVHEDIIPALALFEKPGMSTHLLALSPYSRHSYSTFPYHV